MRKILFVIPSLSYSGAGKHLTLLAKGLSRDRFEPRLCVLGRDGPVGEVLRKAGWSIDVLGWRRRVDLTPAWRLRQLVRAWQPDVIHLWQPGLLRILALLLGRSDLRKCVVSAPLAATVGQDHWLDRWLLRRTARVVASGPSEAERCSRSGLVPDRVVQVPFGVDLLEPETTEENDPLPVSVPPARLLLCVGPFEFHKGYQDAIWALDILKYLYHDLHLLLAGGGPDRDRLEEFARNIRVLDRVHFLGPRADLARLMPHCDVVWIPSHVEAGRNVTLEAMAAGRPIVASRLPGLAEIIRDGETGFLVPPGDKPALARQTRLLLDDVDLRGRMGAAGRQRVQEHFTAKRMVESFAHLYEATSP